MRRALNGATALLLRYFPSFSEGLSLRRGDQTRNAGLTVDFPSFSEGLSLRQHGMHRRNRTQGSISLPFRRDFH